MRRSKRAAAQSAKKMQADSLTQRDAAPVPARNVIDADAVEAAELDEAQAETSSEEEPSSHEAAEESLTAEQHSEEEPELDAFEEDTRAAVDALQEAVTEPAAFLRPSSEISELARQAARVSERPRQLPPLSSSCHSLSHVATCSSSTTPAPDVHLVLMNSASCRRCIQCCSRYPKQQYQGCFCSKNWVTAVEAGQGLPQLDRRLGRVLENVM